MWIHPHLLTNLQRLCRSPVNLKHCLLCKSTNKHLKIFISLSYYLRHLLFIQVNVSKGLLDGLLLKLELLCSSTNMIKCVMIKIHGARLCKTLICFAFVNLIHHISFHSQFNSQIGTFTKLEADLNQAVHSFSTDNNINNNNNSKAIIFM